VAKGGKVHLFKVEEYPEDWKPENDSRIPVWEALHHLIRVFRKEGQEGAGRLLAKLGTMQDAIRKLAYLLYGQCERAKRSEEARAYNEVMVAWDNIRVVADQAPKTGEQQRLEL
jgi:putative DNA methylase